MTFQEVVNQVSPAVPYVAGATAGVFLQKFFNVVGLIASFFASKPDVMPALIEVVKDVVEKQNDLMADIAVLLQALKAQQNAVAPK